MPRILQKNKAKRATVDADRAKPAKSSTPAPRVDGVDAARTEGQRLLLAVPGSLSAVAKAIRCSKTLAGYWRTGQKTPAAVFRAKLHSVYGIPVDAWGRAAAVEDAPPPAKKAPSATSPATSPAGDVLARFDEMIADTRARRQSKSLLASEYARMISTEARLLRERAIAEREINREHPEWKRWYQAVLDALHAHPRALADVVAAVKRVA